MAAINKTLKIVEAPDKDAAIIDYPNGLVGFWYKDEDLLCGGCQLTLGTPKPGGGGKLVSSRGGQVILRCPRCRAYNELPGPQSEN
jgi:hypothetical protein